MSDRLERMHHNPVGDWTGAERRLTLQSGPSSDAEKLTIPYKRPIKPVYIRKLVAFIDAVRKLQ